MAYTEQINYNYSAHVLNEDMQTKAQRVREYAKDFAAFIDDNVPAGREQALALTNLEQVMFWANAGIARAKS